MWHALAFIWAVPFIFFAIVGIIFWVEGLWRDTKYLENFGKPYRQMREEWEEQKRLDDWAKHNPNSEE